MQCYSHVAQLRQPRSAYPISLLNNYGHDIRRPVHTRGDNPSPIAHNAMHYLLPPPPPPTNFQGGSPYAHTADQYKQHDAEMRERHKSYTMLPPSCYCPLSKKLLVDAVILRGDEISYDRVAIEEHLRNTKSCSTSPANPKVQLKHGKHAKQLLKNKTLSELVKHLARI